MENLQQRKEQHWPIDEDKIIIMLMQKFIYVLTDGITTLKPISYQSFKVRVIRNVCYRSFFVWDKQLVFVIEWYQYSSCALTIKNGITWPVSMYNSLLDKRHRNASHHSYYHQALFRISHSKLWCKPLKGKKKLTCDYFY